MGDQVFYRDTWVEVDLDAIRENILAFTNYLHGETKIMAVVKANGYGHGAYEVAQTVLAAGVDYLAVALLDEAIALRKQGITAPILVFGWVHPSEAEQAVIHNITLTVFQEEWLREIERLRIGPLSLHLKVDTGMSRLGVKCKQEAEAIIDLIQKEKLFFLEGLYTHFATADHLEGDLFDIQQRRFREWVQWLTEKGESPPIIHMSNSAAASRIPDKSYHYIRLGISMYGLRPSNEVAPPFPLHEAFSLHSRLIHVKELYPGETVSYGATYTVKEREWIGTIPIGYADGWARRLAKTAVVLVDGERVPIVGRICMDQCMVRLRKKAKVGTKVTLIGTEQTETITVDDIAMQLDTINYEVPSMISERVPRLYVRDDEIIKVSNPVLRLCNE